MEPAFRAWLGSDVSCLHISAFLLLLRLLLLFFLSNLLKVTCPREVELKWVFSQEFHNLSGGLGGVHPGAPGPPLGACLRQQVCAHWADEDGRFCLPRIFYLIRKMCKGKHYYLPGTYSAFFSDYLV